MKDGAHTHHDHGPGGMGLALSIAAGLVLADVIRAILPVLLTILAVTAGLAVLGMLARAVASSGSAHQLPPPGLDGRPSLPVANDQTQMAAAPVIWPGLPAQHQHLHFHGLDPAQVAAVLAAQHDQHIEGHGDAW